MFRTVTGYVDLEDSLLGSFTVLETMRMAAKLSLPNSVTFKQIEARVDDVVEAMGLATCRHTLVGDIFRKGMSGGQKRRLSIAIELLSNPSVFFLDEPTSGLDSSATHNVMSDDLTEEDLVLLLFYVQAFVMFMLCAAVLHRGAHRGCARAGQQQQLAERRELRPAGGSHAIEYFLLTLFLSLAVSESMVHVVGAAVAHYTIGIALGARLHDAAGTVVVADEAAVWEDAEGEVDPDVDAAMAAVLAKVTSPLEVEPAVDAAVEVEAESAACGIDRC
eukprot:jgi/Phyca11/13938/fgenesh1_pg.PHYCAscaffold_5_\